MRRRVYCGRTGLALPVTPEGCCPECGIRTHRVIASSACEAFAACGGHPYEQEHGHPCELPADHAGPCACPAACAACRARVPSVPCQRAAS